jgi:hypothetical protein
VLMVTENWKKQKFWNFHPTYNFEIFEIHVKQIFLLHEQFNLKLPLKFWKLSKREYLSWKLWLIFFCKSSLFNLKKFNLVTHKQYFYFLHGWTFQKLLWPF